MITFFVTIGRMIAVFGRGLRDTEFRTMFITLLGSLLSGTIFYRAVEGWGIVDSAYFCVMTISTVGCDSLQPTTDLSKIFTMVYLVIGVGLFMRFIVKVVSHQRTGGHYRQTKEENHDVG